VCTRCNTQKHNASLVSPSPPLYFSVLSSQYSTKLDESGYYVEKRLPVQCHFYDDLCLVRISELIIFTYHITWTLGEGSHRGLDYFVIFYSTSGIVRTIEIGVWNWRDVWWLWGRWGM